MSDQKTVTLPTKKVKAPDTQQQSSTPPAVCCEKIRELAYIKWEAAGGPCGDGVEFWLVAEAELLGDASSEETAGK